jgi:Xaa-Pro aminopeptidase
VARDHVVHQTRHKPQRGSATNLVAGNTFTDKPGIYIPGELGVRHEDTLAVTENGCEKLAPKWSGSPEEPAVV